MTAATIDTPALAGAAAVVAARASPREAAPDPSPRRHHRSLADTPPLLLSDDCLPG